MESTCMYHGHHSHRHTLCLNARTSPQRRFTPRTVYNQEFIDKRGRCRTRKAVFPANAIAISIVVGSLLGDHSWTLVARDREVIRKREQMGN